MGAAGAGAPRSAEPRSGLRGYGGLIPQGCAGLWEDVSDASGCGKWALKVHDVQPPQECLPDSQESAPGEEGEQ